MLLLAVVIYIALKQNPYRVLRKKELVFAEEVRKEIQEEFLKMKKNVGWRYCAWSFDICSCWQWLGASCI